LTELKIIENTLYRSLTKETDEFEKFYADFKSDNETIRKELNDSYKLYKKFRLQKKHGEEFREVFDTLKNLLKGIDIFAYGFYHNGDETPLYIGVTGNKVTRVIQHFQWYSSAFIKFPMVFLDEIRVWSSNKLTKDNIKQFENFLIDKLNPYFNIKHPKQEDDDEIFLYQEVKQNETKIPVSKFRELFKKFS